MKRRGRDSNTRPGEHPAAVSRLLETRMGKGFAGRDPPELSPDGLKGAPHRGSRVLAIWPSRLRRVSARARRSERRTWTIASRSGAISWGACSTTAKIRGRAPATLSRRRRRRPPRAVGRDGPGAPRRRGRRRPRPAPQGRAIAVAMAVAKLTNYFDVDRASTPRAGPGKEQRLDDAEWWGSRYGYDHSRTKPMSSVDIIVACTVTCDRDATGADRDPLRPLT